MTVCMTTERLDRFIVRGRDTRAGRCYGCLDCTRTPPCAGDGWQMRPGWIYRRIGNSNFPRHAAMTPVRAHRDATTRATHQGRRP